MNNNLTVIECDGQLMVDSREVKDMLNMRHADLLEKIDGYIQILENGKLRSLDFFIENSYTVDGNKRPYKYYLLTRKGCDMVANKMNGTKGVLFTAHYVTRFEEMEKELLQPKTELEVLAATVNNMVQQEKRITVIENEQKRIFDLIGLNPSNWRKEINKIIRLIAKESGLSHSIIWSESYKTLETRGKCNLQRRLDNKRNNMKKEGASKTKVEKANFMDIIDEDTKLTEIFLAIVKDMAVKYKVTLKKETV
ncbi:Rha family transcriptional regulator [Bacillus velezensis]|uniref:Rha family transcriptional regulator n=1 Tax=Bacillus velezensis TaxID=492670 RepID=UPI001F4939AC|nr:Rha family transcriptional regulator [Bacillus velezensis]